MNTKKTGIGLAVAAAVGAGGYAVAGNPFGMQTMERGYLVAQAGEGKCGAGKCGQGKCGSRASAPKASKTPEAVCGGGRCSVATMDGNKDGKVSKAEFSKHHEAMFSKIDSNNDGYLSSDELAKIQEGKCGSTKAMDGQCGGNKAMEGKCGEGKCGGRK